MLKNNVKIGSKKKFNNRRVERDVIIFKKIIFNSEQDESNQEIAKSKQSYLFLFKKKQPKTNSIQIKLKIKMIQI